MSIDFAKTEISPDIKIIPQDNAPERPDEYISQPTLGFVGFEEAQNAHSNGRGETAGRLNGHAPIEGHATDRIQPEIAVNNYKTRNTPSVIGSLAIGKRGVKETSIADDLVRVYLNQIGRQELLTD